MNKILRNRLIYFIALAVIGLFFLGFSFTDIIENAVSAGFGFGMFIVSIINIIILIRVSKNPKQLENYLFLRADERTQFVNLQSYSFTFWVAIFVDFVLAATLPFFNLQVLGLIVGASLILKIIIYFLAHFYFNKKY